MLSVARTRIGIGVIAVLVMLAMLVAACGGGDDDDGGDNGGATDAPTAQPTDGGDDGGDDDGGEATPGAFEETYAIDETFWYGGFMVEIGDAIHSATEPDAFSDQDFLLTLEATITNEGDSETFFSPSMALVWPNGTYTARSSGLQVPGGLSSSAEIVFSVEEDFAIDDAYLLVGEGNEQRAQVPLGPGGGELVALEPSEVALTETISNSLIDMRFSSADIRADLPFLHSQAEDGKLFVTFNFDVTSRKSGNWSIFANEFALTTPSGTSVAVDGVELPGLLGSDAGLDTSDLYLRFVVDEPVEGTYTLRWTPSDRWVGDGDPAEETVEFEL